MVLPRAGGGVARPQYPSDRSRAKTRPHAKVHLSARTHRKTAGHFDDAEFRGQFLGLLMVAVEANSARVGGKLHLSRANVAWISGKRRADVALKSVQRLLNVLEYSWELQGEVLVTSIPKLAKKQGFDSALRSGATRTPDSPDTDTDTDTETEKEQGPVAGAPDLSLSGSEPPKPKTSKQRARAVWPKLVEAAARQGKVWRSKASDARLNLIAARLKHDDLSEDELIQIIDGAMIAWGEGGVGFEPLKNLTPETLYRPCNWPKYLEAAAEPQKTGPMTIEQLRATRAERWGDTSGTS